MIDFFALLKRRRRVGDESMVKHIIDGMSLLVHLVTGDVVGDFRLVENGAEVQHLRFPVLNVVANFEPINPTGTTNRTVIAYRDDDVVDNDVVEAALAEVGMYG